MTKVIKLVIMVHEVQFWALRSLVDMRSITLLAALTLTVLTLRVWEVSASHLLATRINLVPESL